MGLESTDFAQYSFILTVIGLTIELIVSVFVIGILRHQSPIRFLFLVVADGTYINTLLIRLINLHFLHN